MKKLIGFVLMMLCTCSHASASKVILNIAGNTPQVINQVKVSNDWDIKYSYNCSGYGLRSLFAIHIIGPPKAYAEHDVNEFGTKGNGVDYLHGGKGLRNIYVNSDCSWAISVITE